MNLPPPAPNPYAAPQQAPPAIPPALLAPPTGRHAVKWLYLAAVVVGTALAAFVSVGATLKTAQVLEVPQLAIGLAAIGWILVFLCQCGLAIAWLVGAWGVVPVEDRGGLSVGGAIARLFIPFYGIYWMFVMPRRLCDGMERVLARAGRPVPLPRDLAGLAGAAMMASSMGNYTSVKDWTWVVVGIGHVLWFLFMKRMDEAERVLRGAQWARFG